jgi:hypothetical protein
MRTHPNELLSSMDSLEKEFSLLVTLAEADINWNSVPACETLIIKERLTEIGKLVSELFDRLEKFEPR